MHAVAVAQCEDSRKEPSWPWRGSAAALGDGRRSYVALLVDCALIAGAGLVTCLCDAGPGIAFSRGSDLAAK